MAHLRGYGATTYVTPNDGAVGIGGPVLSGSPTLSVVDGTPVRVCVMALAAAAGLVALKLAGLRFNVGVSA